MIRLVFTVLFFVLLGVASAQEMGTDPQMADTFRQEGKIYVVIGVIAIIFISIVGWLFYIERKLRKLEKEINQSNGTQTRSAEKMESRQNIK